MNARIRVETDAELTVSASARNVILTAGGVNVLLTEDDAVQFAEELVNTIDQLRINRKARNARRQ